ncbi:hypothetical protein AABM34_20325 [Lysinibacillus fusiformis]
MSAYMNILSGITEQARTRAEREADILNQREKEAREKEASEQAEADKKTAEEMTDSEKIELLTKAVMELTLKMNEIGGTK